MTGKLLGKRYEILEKIDSGGMADIYRAVCTKTKRTVAVKVLKDKFSIVPEYVRRFKKEAETVFTLEHENIVSVTDIGFDEGVYYIVMEYIEGSTLKALIEKNGRIGEKEAVKYAIQVCSALSAAHKKGIIHRDVKPHNILINNEDNVKLTDFGIAQSISSIEDQENKVIGSVHYISPEQARGEKIDTRSDIYSLGIVLYEAVTGILPHTGGKTVSVALKHINEQITPPSAVNSDISEALNYIILKATSKNKKDRYQSVIQLKNDLTRSAADPEGGFLDIDQSNKKPFVDPLKQKKKNLLWKAGMLALLIVVLAAAVILIITLFNPSETSFIIPNLVGADLGSADLRSLTVNTVYEPSESAKEGVVISQSPQAGSKAAYGSVLNLTISSGPSDLVMPDLYGATLEEAKAQLGAMGVTLDKDNITYEYQPVMSPGIIISQAPEAGDTLDKTDVFSLVISAESAEEGAIMPDAKNHTIVDAVSNLNNAGFNNCFVYEDEDESGLEPGTVIRQTPEQGIQTAFTDNIYLWISSYKDKEYSCRIYRTIYIPEKGSKISVVVEDNTNDNKIDFIAKEINDQYGQVTLDEVLYSSEPGSKNITIFINNIYYDSWTVTFN